MKEEPVIPVKCRTCKKTPKNCKCFEYRLEIENNMVYLYVDNVATDPVRNEEVGTWQARRNARIWRRPQYVDGFGPILVFDRTDALNVQEEIDDGKFYLLNYENRDGYIIPRIEKGLKKRLGFLRKPRKSRLHLSNDVLA